MSLKHVISSIAVTVAISIVPVGTMAYVDDAGIMNKFNYTNTQYLYDYLNNNNFRFYNKEFLYDAYIKNDNSLFMTISTDHIGGLLPWSRKAGMMGVVVILKPGYATDKGIEVGMKAEQMSAAYGTAVPKNRQDVYNNDPGTGYYVEGKRRFTTDYGQQETFKYYIASFFDRDAHWVQFLIDKSSNKIVAIGYFRGKAKAGSDNLFLRNLSDWGLWRFVLEDRMKEHPLKSGWRAISDAWKGI